MTDWLIENWIFLKYSIIQGVTLSQHILNLFFMIFIKEFQVAISITKIISFNCSQQQFILLSLIFFFLYHKTYMRCSLLLSRHMPTFSRSAYLNAEATLVKKDVAFLIASSSAGINSLRIKNLECFYSFCWPPQ